MAEYHVGCGFGSIYAGTWANLKSDTDGFHTWRNKSEVTNEAIHAVMTYLLPAENGEVRSVKAKHNNGKTVELLVRWSEDDD